MAGLSALFAITAAWWALALWPVAAAPDWLERTRYVCFGVGDSGLPDAGGWVGLVGAPLGMLAILVVGWRRGVTGLLRRAGTSARVATALSCLALGSALLLGGASLRVRQAAAAGAAIEVPTAMPAATYPRIDRAAPPLALVGQHGATVDLAALGGRAAIVTFAFAHCTTVCPLVVRDALAAQRLAREAGHRPAVLIVTLDPWRDTPGRLPAMARQWALPAEDAWVLSGSPAEVESVLDDWEVPRSRDATTGEVTHPSLLYVIDPAGRIAYASTGGDAAVAELVRRAAAPLRRPPPGAAERGGPP